MKNITLSIVAVIMAIITISCNQASNKNQQSSNDTAVVSEEQPSSRPKDDDTVAASIVSETSSGQDAKATGKEEAKNFSIAPIVNDYLSLKNALVSDDDKAAASAGRKLLATLNKMDMNAVPADKHKKYMDITEDAKEHAEHIDKNVGNILHQREHLAMLSEDLKDLISLFGTSKPMYKVFCPMFNDNKGAFWLSDSREVKNPYYGKEMLSCGEVKEEIK
ncbi:hypothetical protein BCY91_05575 [Pelobium manganitolerans]|uniref:DUF3347 domain-containing protein n=1 Tax=Pelobium manganitolerans TaxID=1842495 RepID=A0A419S6C2_9SPHI|nr:DUF3347 domain-containing protein [Pelobium manganitolerans]RKD16339.1 hypothetical protein BCY91_05575 [Pelobium manganitolerans]